MCPENCPELPRKCPENLLKTALESNLKAQQKTPQTVAVQGVSVGGDYRTRICDLLRVKDLVTNVSNQLRHNQFLISN